MQTTNILTGRSGRKTVFVAVALLAIVSARLLASSIGENGLYMFSSGTPISSSEVNDNFDLLERRIAHRNFSAVVDSSGYGTHTTLNEALAVITEGTVFVSQGTYQLGIDECDISVASGVNIVGEGYSTAIELTDINCGSAFILNGHNLVSNLRFVGVTDSAGNGLTVGGDYVTIRDCWFSTGMRGVYAYNAKHLRMIDNTVSSMSEHGVSLNHGSDYAVIRGNKFSDGKRGIYLLDVVGAIITGNYFTGHSARGVFVNRGSTDNIVANNLFFDIEYHAISVENDTSENGEGNSVRNVIVGNIVNRTTSSCIQLGSEDAAPTEDTVVVGNVLHTCGSDGIYGNRNTYYTSAVGNVVSKINRAPFQFDGSTGASMVGNVVNNTGDGILLSGELYTVGGNVLADGGHNGSKDGVRMTGSVYAAVSGNAITSQTRHGIYSHTDSDYVAVSGNLSAGNAGSDIKLAGGNTDCTVVSNVTGNGIDHQGSCAFGYND